MPSSGHTWLLQSLLPETKTLNIHRHTVACHTKSTLCKWPWANKPKFPSDCTPPPLPHDPKIYVCAASSTKVTGNQKPS